jgi:4-hydroxy-3-methylbut-2-enyl diphosphate reductase IspH
VEDPSGIEELMSCLAPYQSIGLCAGASTPDEVIDQIEDALNRPNKYCGRF